jgi:hypothetical protein
MKKRKPKGSDDNKVTQMQPGMMIDLGKDGKIAGFNPQRADAPDVLHYRSFPVRSSTLNEENRTVEAMIATENPVTEFDFERWEFVPRVLLAAGAEYARQIPLLDSHQRNSTEDQLGSIRNLRRKKVGEVRGVTGRLHFSAMADRQFTKVKEQHITDVSAGFEIKREVHVPDGETAEIQGQSYTGPVNVVTKWRLREGSITPIGADELAKLRGYDPSQVIPPKPKEQERTFEMDEKLKELLVSRGMPQDLSDGDSQKWAVDNADDLFASDKPEGGERTEGGNKELVELLLASVRGKIDEPVPDTPLTRDDVTALLEGALDGYEKRREDRLVEHRQMVDDSIDLAFGESPPDGLAERCYQMESVEDVRTAIKETRAKESEGLVIPGGSRLGMGAGQRDKHQGALRDALIVRAMTGAGCSGDRIEKECPTEKRAAGWGDFQDITLLDFARECLVADGYSLRGLSPEKIAIAALGWPEKVGLRSAPAYHTTGSFATITQDALNKSLLAGYQEAPQTWRGPMRQANSVADFKTIHRISLGAIPNIPVWPDNEDPQDASVSEQEETYAVEARSLGISFSWRLLVNDDMDALSRTPQLLGDACARTVNSVAWAQVTSNPTMTDGQVLFLAAAAGNRKRANLTTGAGTPSVTTVGTLTNLMRQMRGLNTPEGNESDDILNLSPAYIIGPSALETTILQLVRSIADPADNKSSAVYNPTRSLMPVIEPLLDANSTTAWYLFASPSRVDTVEVTFLQGQESPVTRDFVDEETLSKKYIVMQSFAAKAIDHRGVQRHDGA